MTLISPIKWTKGGPSRYHLIAAQLRERIKQGRAAPGARIPTEKEMTEVYGWSRGTVRAACLLLEQEGFIRKEHGMGMFVSDELPS